MRIGLSAYDMAAADLLDLVRAAEDAGFDSLWLGEHVFHPQEYTSVHPGHEVKQHHTGPIVQENTHLLDPLVTLAAAAATTERIRLATGVFVLPLREPLLVARAAATLAEISGGRFVLGVGAGWLTEEFDALGVPFKTRGRRLDESLAVLRACLGGGPVEHHGDIFDFAALEMTPAPVDVPLVIGGNSDAALRRAARSGDGWFSSGTPDFEEAVRLRDRLQGLREELGKTAEPFETVVRIEGADPQDVRRYGAAGFDHVVIWADQVWPADGSLDEKRTRLTQAARALRDATI
ncbi:TIGR03619 family F420-dependent LLM class oxidoreductase [Nocardioides sp. Root190]|uniref:TIGR03619 family F420-dependent LLM class oxidoreductase n=1 Tax=Nocardioides sp. Root190 TaxID=1736488 RepID=UPI0009E7ECA0|nr:TIGR03619 family F420-dependent LLM class oxidoreductase [Nocardioides sp. Root190]